MRLNYIDNCDCLEGMKAIPAGAVDLVLCDLPYGTTACKWDTVIPFDRLWAEYARVCKPDGVVVLFGSQPFTSKLITSNVEWFREELVWLKNRPASGLNAKAKHLKVHENVIIFSRSGQYTYNPQKWEVTDKQFLTQRKTMAIYGEGNQIYNGLAQNRKPDDGTRNPISVMAYRVPISPAKTKTYKPDVETRVHPTQKPVALCEYLIKTYTNPGEVVLDNCMGSGTTAMACIKTGRNYIGFELDERYHAIAMQRIAAEAPAAIEDEDDESWMA